MESEHSYSGESSGSGSSSGSSDSEDDTLEPVNILGISLELPQDLCEDYGIFKEFFSTKTWNNLGDEHKAHLKKFLPTFKENDDEEKEKTVEMLFNRETFHFTSPVNHFYHNLKQGNYRPDIAKMKKFLMKARARQQRQKIKSYYSKLLPDVLLSRERLLTVAKDAPPGPTPRLPALARRPVLKPYYQSPQVRAKQRYFEELAAIRSEVGGEESDDDNYPEGPTTIMSVRRRKQNIMNSPDTNVMGTLGGSEIFVRSSLGCLKNILTAHSTRRQYRDIHPELNTSGITLEDVKQRVSLVNGKKLMFGSQKAQDSPIQKLRKAPKKEYVSKSKAKTKEIESEIGVNNVESNKQMVLSNLTVDHEVDSEAEVSNFVEPIKSPKQIKKPEIKEKKMELEPKVTEEKREPVFKPSKEFVQEVTSGRVQEPKEIVMPSSRSIKQPVPLSLEDLDGIDMMALPIELADECEVTNEPSTEESEADDSLMQTTYACFFSLVRALFPAKAAHRASVSQLRAKCATLMKSPIAPLNTWYTQSDNWCAELDSALEFLAGEKGSHPDDFVPYLQHMRSKDQRLYQWIGAGRDCDGNLTRLCDRWIKSRTVPKHQPIAPIVVHDIPPARSPTVWKVRKPTTTELIEFREQELRRFSVIAKPYSYVQFGYQSVVGPWSVRATTSASQATLLRNDRPRHATFTAILRDAIARLPNGEGTKQDIITLLKMSQWILPVSDQTLLSAVTAALDRLHSAKREPMIKYDPRTNLWTYLYRHRSEEDWAKPVTARSRIKLPTGQASGTTISLYKEVPPSPTVPMDMEVASIEEVVENASDSDVDVEDGGTGNTASSLSSAQLLIQATKAKLQEQKLYNRPNPPVNQTINRQPAPATLRKEIVTIPAPVKQMKPKVSEVVKKVGPPVAPTQVTTSPVNKPKPKVERPVLVQTSPVPMQRPKTVQAITVTSQPKPSPNSIIRPTLVKQRAATSLHNSVPPLVPTHVQTVVTTTHNAPIPSNNIQRSVTTQQAQATTKVVQANRSLLLRPTAAPSTTVAVTTAALSPSLSAQIANRGRRGVVRVLSPAANSSGKSLISPRALLQTTTQVNQVNTPVKRKTPVQTTMTTGIQNTTSTTTVVSSQPTVVTASVGTRTVQLANGRTVQLASGQTVQLASGHTLLSSLPVRLPSGQTVQLAAPRTKSLQSLPNMQTVQLTGHTVKLPSGQSVQVASQTGQVQLPSGQTVNALQLGQNVQIPNTVQLTGQTVQLASGQTVQLPSGQTLQLQSGQTVQLSSGQAIQLSSGQTVQLASQVQSQKTQHIVRSQSSGEKSSQPIVAKLLTNAQGQMISLEGMVGGTRTLQIAGVRPQGPKTMQAVQGSMRVVSGSGGNRVTRPLLLTSTKPLHNLILQSDGSAVRVTSSGGTTPSQTLVLASQSGGTSSNSTPVLKLQQVNSIQQIKLSQGIKIQQSGSSTSSSPGNVSTVRSVVMDGQQLKLVGGKHVLARLLRPANPP